MPDYVAEFQTRWRDTDAMGHVNNAVYCSFIDHVSVALFADLLDVPMTDVPLAVVHLEMDYRGQIELRDVVTSAVTVTDIGETSIHFDHELRVGEDVVAEATAIRVAFDRETGSAKTVPEEWERKLAEYRSS